MSKIHAARSAVRDGGAKELVRRTRLWAAGRLYPGTMPTARRPKPAGRKPKSPSVVVPQASAHDVEHAQAFAFFDARRATYERLSSAVAPYVDPEGTFYDIGGNIGYFTMVLAERIGFRGKVHLFEPVPNLVRLCAETLANAPYEVAIHEYGLGVDDAKVDIFLATQGNLGWNTVVAERATIDMERVEIQIRSFGSTGIADVPSFIKIDVEGAEHLVLGGLMSSLAEWPSKPVILCEVGWGRNHPQWELELAAFAQLEAIGYRCADLNGDSLDVSTLEKTTDVLFLP